MENPNIFKDRLHEVRKSHGLTQRQIADSLGIIHQNVNNWEKGLSMPSIETFVKLCKYLDVSLDYMAGVSDDPTPLKRD